MFLRFTLTAPNANKIKLRNYPQTQLILIAIITQHMKDVTETASQLRIDYVRCVEPSRIFTIDEKWKCDTRRHFILRQRIAENVSPLIFLVAFFIIVFG